MPRPPNWIRCALARRIVLSRPMRGKVAIKLKKSGFCDRYAAGTGSAVTDLIFSIANRDVTFFSGTALISFL